MPDKTKYEETLECLQVVVDILSGKPEKALMHEACKSIASVASAGEAKHEQMKQSIKGAHTARPLGSRQPTASHRVHPHADAAHSTPAPPARPQSWRARRSTQSRSWSRRRAR